MTLADMREPGVHHLIGLCLNDGCLHALTFRAEDYAGEIEVSCLHYGGSVRHITFNFPDSGVNCK